MIGRRLVDGEDRAIAESFLPAIDYLRIEDVVGDLARQCLDHGIGCPYNIHLESLPLLGCSVFLRGVGLRQIFGANLLLFCKL